MPREIIEKIVEKSFLTSKEYWVLTKKDNPNLIDKIEIHDGGKWESFKNSYAGERIINLADWLGRSLL